MKDVSKLIHNTEKAIQNLFTPEEYKEFLETIEKRKQAFNNVDEK